jgi:PrgI family protein
MQFKVPQFLDIEDKIFGPFTFRQFVYLAGGAGLCFVIFRLLGFYLGFIPIAAIAVLSWALAYYRPNNKPFINMIESSFKYAAGSKLYIWQRRKNQSKGKGEEETVPAMSMRDREPRLTQSKLRDLAWSLDVLDMSKGGGQLRRDE